jgi:hypothetical protein
MVELVQRMLDLPTSRPPRPDRFSEICQVCRLVYELYDLTDEEIAIVEGGSQTSQT